MLPCLFNLITNLSRDIIRLLFLIIFIFFCAKCAINNCVIEALNNQNVKNEKSPCHEYNSIARLNNNNNDYMRMRWYICVYNIRIDDDFISAVLT